MAYTTHIQQVLAYLKQGNKILPSAGTALPQPTPTAPAIAGLPAPKQGMMPMVNPKQVRPNG